MNANTGKVAAVQQLVQFVRTGNRFDEDDDLVELELIQEVVKLAVLCHFFQIDVVLLQPVKSELRLVIDEDFERLGMQGLIPVGTHVRVTHVRHELLASDANLLGQRSAEHHDLLVVGRNSENFLDVSTHVCG